MLTDQGLRLATAENVASVNGGAAPGGLGPASVTLGLDPSGLTSKLRNFAEIGSGERMTLAFNVTTAFTTGTFGATIEFQLISIPIVATLLTNATTAGKTLTIAGVVTNNPANTLTIAAHGLPLGTPIFLTALSGTTGVSNSVIYYVIPTGVNTFTLALSLEDAVAGSAITLTTAGTSTVNFIPTKHGSSGTLTMYNAGVPTQQGALRLESRFQVPLRSLATLTPRQALPAGQTLSQPLGAGPTEGLIAANAQHYYYLRYIPVGGSVTAGAVTCDLVLEAGDSLKHYAPGYEVI